MMSALKSCQTDCCLRFHYGHIPTNTSVSWRVRASPSAHCWSHTATFYLLIFSKFHGHRSSTEIYWLMQFGLCSLNSYIFSVTNFFRRSLYSLISSLVCRFCLISGQKISLHLTSYLPLFSLLNIFASKNISEFSVMICGTLYATVRGSVVLVKGRREGLNPLATQLNTLIQNSPCNSFSFGNHALRAVLSLSLITRIRHPLKLA